MRCKRMVGLILGCFCSLLLSKANLRLDPNFKPQFEPNTAVRAFVLRPTGEIIAAVAKVSATGQFEQSLVQFKADGSPDDSFQCTARPSVWGRGMQLQTDGKLLVNGNEKLLRIFPNGELDPTFSPPVLVPYDFALDPQGRIYIAGDFFRIPTNGIQRLYLSRLHPDGRLDESFIAATTHGAPRESGMVRITVQPDGKPVMAGIFRSPAGKHYFARFLEDGSDDPTFSNMNEPIRDFCTQLKVLSDSSILRSVTLLNNAPCIERFLPDRTRDQNFNSDTSLRGVLGYFDVQKDGKIIASVGLTPRNQPQLVRFQQNGALDHSFESSHARFSPHEPGSAFESGIANIIVQPNGDILVGGAFTSYNGQNVTNLVRFIGERAYVTSIEPKQDALHVSWLVTEPEKTYALETSTDLLTWSEHNNFMREGDSLKVTLPQTGDHRFIRAIQK